MLRASPAVYGEVQVVRVDYDQPKRNLDGKVDLVLVMREVHMMVNWGTFDGAADRAKYAAIGESDRMTLKSVRLADGAGR